MDEALNFDSALLPTPGSKQDRFEAVLQPIRDYRE